MTHVTPMTRLPVGSWSDRPIGLECFQMASQSDELQKNNSNQTELLDSFVFKYSRLVASGGQ